MKMEWTSSGRFLAGHAAARRGPRRTALVSRRGPGRAGISRPAPSGRSAGCPGLPRSCAAGSSHASRWCARMPRTHAPGTRLISSNREYTRPGTVAIATSSSWTLSAHLGPARGLVNQVSGEHRHLDVGALGSPAQQVERFVRRARQLGHHDALGLLDHWIGGPRPQCDDRCRIWRGSRHGQPLGRVAATPGRSASSRLHQPSKAAAGLTTDLRILPQI